MIFAIVFTSSRLEQAEDKIGDLLHLDNQKYSLFKLELKQFTSAFLHYYILGLKKWRLFHSIIQRHFHYLKKGDQKKNKSEYCYKTYKINEWLTFVNFLYLRFLSIVELSEEVGPPLVDITFMANGN